MHNLEDRKLLYNMSVRDKGLNNQLLVVAEELGELISAISHFNRGRIDKHKLASEVADVELMIEKTKTILELWEITEEVKPHQIKRMVMNSK